MYVEIPSRRVRVTIVTVEKQILDTMGVCLHSCFGYPVSKAHIFCAV